MKQAFFAGMRYRVVFAVKGGGYRSGRKCYTYQEAMGVMARRKNGKRIEEAR